MRNLLGLVLAVGAGLGAGCGYNDGIAADEHVKAAWSNVENVYQRRADLIPNLVATVKGSAAHEEKVLAEVTAARASATQIHVDASVVDDPEKLKQFAAAQQQLSSSLGRLIAVSESYPDLKANASFRDLQAQLEGTENRITVERRKFNEAVEEYNRIVRQFPSSCGAKMAGLKARETFKATTAGAEKAPEVKF